MITFKKEHNRQSDRASRNRTALGLLLGVMGLLILTACSDWDDHYDANTSLVASQQSTLWENIAKNENLSQFATLVKKSGYDAILNASQSYTVWAPVNGSFDYDVLNATDSSRLLRQFVQNHIARYNYPASGNLNQKVYMLNEKLMHFQGDGTYKMQDVPLNDGSIACNNGMIHLLQNKIPFMQNIYESLNNEQFEIDLISEYYHKYDVRKLNEVQSVAGPIVDGEQTYLDSVFYESNQLTSLFNAYINQEDSNYSMLIPTNKAWKEARDTIMKFFNYVPTFRFVRTTASGADTTIVVNLSDADELRDSVTNLMLFRGLTFNNNILDNKKLGALASGQSLDCDSLVNTTGDIFYADDSKKLFENTLRVDKSNGAIWVTDTIGLPTWCIWNPEIVAQAEGYVYKTQYAGETGFVRVNSSNQNPNIAGKVSNGYYYEARPNTPSDHPDIYIHLPNVRSAEYNVYIVMIPGNMVSTQAEYKPNSFSAFIRYAQSDGSLVTEQKNQFKNPDGSGSLFVTSDEAKIDTILLGSVTFPIAYVGTGENYPYLHIKSRFSSSNNDKYDRTLRVDCVILRPKALDEYLKAHPGYKYDKYY